jgi:ribulose 1,5-bisphosphate synthetase/thiazole synthase
MDSDAAGGTQVSIWVESDRDGIRSVLEASLNVDTTVGGASSGITAARTLAEDGRGSRS